METAFSEPLRIRWTVMNHFIIYIEPKQYNILAKTRSIIKCSWMMMKKTLMNISETWAKTESGVANWKLMLWQPVQSLMWSYIRLIIPAMFRLITSRLGLCQLFIWVFIWANTIIVSEEVMIHASQERHPHHLTQSDTT